MRTSWRGRFWALGMVAFVFAISIGFALVITDPVTDDGSDIWVTTMVIFILIPQGSFSALFGMTPWWRSHLGRAVMVKAISVFLLGIWGLMSRILDPDGFWLEAIRNAATTAVAVGVWYQFLAFLQVKYRAWKNHEDEWAALSGDSGQGIKHKGKKRFLSKDA